MSGREHWNERSMGMSAGLVLFSRVSATPGFKAQVDEISARCMEETRDCVRRSEEIVAAPEKTERILPEGDAKK